ncbi:SusC/RagA family TonB-linked outer membrane protein [Bacteroidota bacterium]
MRLLIKLVIIGCIYSISISSMSQTSNCLDSIIYTEIKTYTLNELLDILSEKKCIILTYNINELPGDGIIVINQSSYTLKKLLNLITNQLPVEYTYIKGHIIIKKRKLEKSYRIKGNITEDQFKEMMVGVNVYIKETLRGCISDNKGDFLLKHPPGQYTVIFSFMGYESENIPVNLYNDINLDVLLKQSEKKIEEVRISGQRQFFGNLDKGRSIQKINAKEIELENSNNVADALHGRLSGVWATKTSGAPGDHIRVRVRGLSSLFASNDPLYVVDGVQIPNVNLQSLGIADLNIHDIDNIKVLKNASATALYGYQGGNGVIIIDTKRGGEKNGLSFTTKIGLQQLPKKYNLMNTENFLRSLDSSRSINNINIRNFYPDYSDSLVSIDWQDELFNKGFMNEYQLAAFGSKRKLNYYFSGNYYTHNGILKGSSYEKISLSTNLGRKIGKKINAEVSLKYSLQDNFNNLDDYLGNEIIYAGINKPPLLPDIPDSMMRYYDIDNPILTVYKGYGSLEDPENPNDYIQNTSKEQKISSFSSHIFINYQILENLNFNFSSSFSDRNQRYELSQKSYAYGATPKYLKSNENYLVLNHQYNLSYYKNLKNHNFNVVTGIKSYTDNVYWNVDSIDDATVYQYEHGLETDNELSRGTLVIHGMNGAVIRSINSFVCHTSYSYKHKYFISLAANYDHLKEGTYSRLKDVFYSTSINWDILQEGWLDFDWLTDLNLYTNYGKSGNYPLNSIAKDLYTEAGYTYINENYKGYSIDQLANHNLKHEEVTEYNFGINLSLFSKRFSLQTDYFNKNNTDLIINREIPIHYGGGNLFLNIGELENKGVDFELEIIPVSTTKLKWVSNANLSHNKQKIIKLDVQDTIIFTDNDILMPDFIIHKNGNLGDIYGYKYLGKYTNKDLLENDEEYTNVSGGKFYNPYTLDYLTENDKVIIGNSAPDFYWNFNNSFDFKFFSIDMLWYGVFGIEKFNATRAASYIAGTNTELNELITDSIKLYNANYLYESSFFIENASFARLKSLTFTYYPEKYYFNKAKLKISLSIENLVTITRYKGYDPETTIYTDNSFTDSAVDKGAYPLPRSVFLSINLKF